MDSSELISLIRETRKRAGMTQAEAARQVGISMEQFNRMELGKNEPRLSTALKALNVVTAAAFKATAEARQQARRAEKVTAALKAS